MFKTTQVFDTAVFEGKKVVSITDRKVTKGYEGVYLINDVDEFRIHLVDKTGNMFWLDSELFTDISFDGTNTRLAMTIVL